jgi:hypothetical protein
MKLYTEEQVLNTVNAIQSYIEKFGIDGAQPTIKNHLKMLAPIELPSDDNIEKELLFGDMITGAIWMKKQILNQNK